MCNIDHIKTYVLLHKNNALYVYSAIICRESEVAVTG